MINKIRIRDRVLSDEEILSLYENRKYFIVKDLEIIHLHLDLADAHDVVRDMELALWKGEIPPYAHLTIFEHKPGKLEEVQELLDNYDDGTSHLDNNQSS